MSFYFVVPIMVPVGTSCSSHIIHWFLQWFFSLICWKFQVENPFNQNSFQVYNHVSVINYKLMFIVGYNDVKVIFCSINFYGQTWTRNNSI